MQSFIRFGALVLVVGALLAGAMNPGRTPTCSCSRGAAFAQVTAVASESPATDLVGTGTTEPAAPAPGTTEATPATTTPDTVDASVPAVAPAASPLPKLVDLGAGKCIPCKKMAPILEEAKKLYEGRANVEFIDVWENPSMGPQYGIRMIPTQIFFDATGKEVFRHEGFFPMEDIQKQFESMGVSLKKE